jgi:hypothetical protein
MIKNVAKIKERGLIEEINEGHEEKKQRNSSSSRRCALCVA